MSATRGAPERINQADENREEHRRALRCDWPKAFYRTIEICSAYSETAQDASRPDCGDVDNVRGVGGKRIANIGTVCVMILTDMAGSCA